MHTKQPRKADFQMAALRLEIVMHINALADKAARQTQALCEHERRSLGQSTRRAIERMEKQHGQ